MHLAVNTIYSTMHPFVFLWDRLPFSRSATWMVESTVGVRPCFFLIEDVCLCQSHPHPFRTFSNMSGVFGSDPIHVNSHLEEDPPSTMEELSEEEEEREPSEEGEEEHERLEVEPSEIEPSGL